MYSVEYTQKAFKELKKMDKYTRKLILAWIEKILLIVLIQDYMEKL